MAEAADGPLDAGDLGSWLAGVRLVLRGAAGSDVPCGSCTACCTSSQFVHVEPDELDTLAHVPSELLFPAPGLPPGHVLMGYDERGHCPMLRDGACTIYAHRPRTCRAYDCRIFPAAGLEADAPAIADRARRWRFGVATTADRTAWDALRARAAALVGGSGTARALRAIGEVLDDAEP